MTAVLTYPESSRHPVAPRAERLAVGILVSNDILRGGLDVALHSLDLVRAVYHFGTAADAGASCIDETPDVVILGVRREEVAFLASTFGGLGAKVLVLINDARAAEVALADGLTTDGFLLQQDLCAATLETALSALAAGEVAIPSRLAHQLLTNAGSRRSQHPIVPASLTPRENETLALLTEGLSNKQIARRLKISDHGAKRLVAGVLLKLGSSNRTSAVVTAIRAGLVECA